MNLQLENVMKVENEITQTGACEHPRGFTGNKNVRVWQSTGGIDCRSLSNTLSTIHQQEEGNEEGKPLTNDNFII